MVQRYEQTRKLQWYKCGAAYARLRSKREDKGVTQTKLAELLNVNQAFISKIEICDRRLDIIELHHICQVLDISFVDFIQEVDRDILSKGEGE